MLFYTKYRCYRIFVRLKDASLQPIESDDKGDCKDLLINIHNT